MISPTDVWSIAQQLLPALTTLYREPLNRLIQEEELAGLPLNLLIHAGDVHPTPLRVNDLLACVPYYQPQAFDTYLARLVAGGWMSTGGAGSYHLTPDGQRLTARVRQVVQARLDEMTPLFNAPLDALAVLLRRLLAACRSDPDVAAKPCLTMTGIFQRENDEPISLLEEIVAGLNALQAYRCDAHLRAWRGFEVAGPAWEAFTLLWRGEADSAETIVERLASEAIPRGYTTPDYALFLRDLAGRGWIEPDASGPGLYQLTPTGKALRIAVEAETDRYFYAPWTHLAHTEAAELQSLLMALCDDL